MSLEDTMNQKSLSREELETCFEHFSDIPNKNEIVLLGKCIKRAGEAIGTSKMLYNPNYKFLKTETDEIPTAKIVIVQPSPVRVTKAGKRFETTLPLFTTDGGVKRVHKIMDNGEKEQYVVCSGKLQNFFVARKEEPSSEMMKYLRDWSMRLYGKEDMTFIKSIVRLIRLNIDGETPIYMPMLNVWIHELDDGAEVVEKLIAEDQLPQINMVTLQGLVYMPPSLTLDPKGINHRLHFKLRVKREDKEDERVPSTQMAENGYDIINIIVNGNDAPRYFEQLKQGYPAQVKGRFENYHYSTKVTLNRYEQSQLAIMLDMQVGSPDIQDFVRFVESENRKVSLPTYNVLAESVDVDYKNWDE